MTASDPETAAVAEAVVAVVGTELLAERVDRNGPVIARALLDRGIEPVRTVVLPDDLETIAEELVRACERHALVVVAGGLGPTDDDVTREAIARALDRPLEEDASVREALERRARDAGRDEPAPGFLRQALAPRGAEVLADPVGTAPSLVAPTARGALVALPGPPHELRAHLSRALDRAAARLADHGVAVQAAPHRTVLRLCGIGESDAAERVAGLRALAGVRVSWLCTPGEVDLRLAAGTAEALCAASEACRERLGPAVVSDDGRGVGDVVVATLAERFETVTAAESFTGGSVAAELVATPGASRVFKASFVTYAEEAKVRILGVPPEVLRQAGVHSEECAAAMAAGARRAGESDFALATTGVAGPDAGADGTPVGRSFLAVAHADHRVEAWTLSLSGDRETIRRRATIAVLDRLRRRLLALDA